jgi:hypothetical protein
MMRKFIYFFIPLFAILFITTGLYSQTVNARFSTSFYTWERYDSIGSESSTKHLRAYQNILLDVSQKKWSFNTNAQLEGDIMEKSGRGFAYRFYSLYIKGSNLFDVMDVKLGRQYVSAGVGRGYIDGAHLKLKLGKSKEYQLTAYGGGLSPLSYDFDYGEKYQLKDNISYGAMFQYYGVKDLMLGVSYYNKHRAVPNYYAPRLDSALFTKIVEIQTEPFADQLAGFDFSFFKPAYQAMGKVYYDVNLKKLFRADVNAGFNVAKNLRFNVGFLYREPQISYNTIFWVFQQKPLSEFEAGLDYTLLNKYNIYFKVSDVMYDNDNSAKFSFGFSHANYGLSFVKYTGYAGESDGAFGYFNYELLKSKFAVTTGLNYSNYSIKNYSEDKVSAFSGILGLVYRPVNHFTVDLQGQIITNKIYKTDTRILLGFNYWLFKKF